MGWLECFKRSRFQKSVVQPEASIGKVQQLHPVASSVDEDKQASVGGVGIELVSYDSRQASKSFSHVGDSGVNEDLRSARNA